MRRVISLSVVAVLAAALATLAAGVASAGGAAGSDGPQLRAHDLPNELSDERRAEKLAALELQAKGAIAKGAKVGEVAKGQYVELAREGEDSIWTVLGEFADLPHNQIAEPDRAADNTTKWEPDFSRAYYLDMLFSGEPGANSVRNFYIEQSSGRYAVNGDVTDWVQVPGNGADYGRTDRQAWNFVRDAVNGWYEQQVAAGKSDAQIAEYLSRFDVWDRYDFDDDGNFDEPDGYIDHFQAIHSGEGEEAGGGTLGADAIWSHRWYASLVRRNRGGPTVDGVQNWRGGVQVGDSPLWIGDYTIEPENGGVGVFSHEFAHDLGLPDEYDTSGNSGGAENSTAFWTLMSSGSWGNDGDPAEGIGDRPFHMNSWDKWFLGWLNYELVSPGDRKQEVRLGPAEANTKQAQALIVVLPDKDGDFNAYVAENRQYLGYDAGLQTGAYNFVETGGVWAERFPYQDGMLVWYYDESQRNNSVGSHPGEGLILPVDARPGILHWADDGTNMRGRYQAYDATFGLEPTDAITLHQHGEATTIPSQPAEPVFDDTFSYWVASDPADAFSHHQAGWMSVNNPHTGTKIRVQSVTPGGFMQVQVTPPK